MTPLSPSYAHSSSGHVGDSRAALGRVGSDGKLVCNFLTRDHKPNQTEELQRIERSGGSLTYLHGGKPFIRGGDFTERQRMGDRPMQLNYSRAFGGKDLKMYGLSCQPDILQVRPRVWRLLVHLCFLFPSLLFSSFLFSSHLTPCLLCLLALETPHVFNCLFVCFSSSPAVPQVAVDASFSCLVLASDGLWDTCSAELAVVEAHNAFRRGVSPADHLVQLGLQVSPTRLESFHPSVHVHLSTIYIACTTWQL